MRSTGADISVKRATRGDLILLQRKWVKTDAVLGMLTGRSPNAGDYGNAFAAKLPNGEIVGFALVALEQKKGVPCATLEHLVVLPRYQNRGLGKKLLGVVNSHLIRAGVKYARLKTSLRGKEFYPKTNWKQVKNNEYHYFWSPKKRSALRKPYK